MGLGTAVALLCAGGVILWLSSWTVIGWAIVGVGLLLFVLSLVFWSTWGGWSGRWDRTVIDEQRRR
jgi:protein-S-isoprenylcysteine O-methyltransferase Ste14